MLDHQESWVPKNWCFWTSSFIMLMNIVQNAQWWTFWTSMIFFIGVEEDSWRPLDCKDIKPVNPKGNKSWIFTGKTDAEAETPILWPPDVKNWLIGKEPDAGKDWRWEEKGTTEDGMVGRHHWFNGHEFEQAPGNSEGERNLACCCPWDCNESNTT